jgi:hypothetical protein
MAFKLKSPFNVTTVGQTLNKPTSVKRETGVSGMQQGLTVPMSEGDQEFGSEPKGNKEIDNLVKKADEGIPLDLNPKQEMRLKKAKDKSKLRQVQREERQTKKAEKMSEKHFGNKFGMTNLDLAEKRLDIYEDQSKKQKALEAQEKKLDEKLSLLDMKGKPNRAGAPIKMLTSIEDKTPMKYKSVRKAERENLMSALAKKGEPVKKEMVNDFTTNLDSSEKIDLGSGPKKKATPKKSDMKKSKNKGKSGKVTVNRKVSTKF